MGETVYRCPTVEGVRLPNRDVHRAVRDRQHSGLDCALEGDDRRSFAAQLQAPQLYTGERTYVPMEAPIRGCLNVC
jgi:hypothetical protein